MRDIAHGCDRQTAMLGGALSTSDKYCAIFPKSVITSQRSNVRVVLRHVAATDKPCTPSLTNPHVIHAVEIEQPSVTMREIQCKSISFYHKDSIEFT
jgi:hypothetical protein